MVDRERRFADAAYWEARYDVHDGEPNIAVGGVHDWYLDYSPSSPLRNILLAYMPAETHPCVLDVGTDASTCDFGLITKQDAAVASHTHRAVAIGGVLTDLSQAESRLFGPTPGQKCSEPP